MRHIILTLSLLLSYLFYGQETTEVTYYKDKYGKTKVENGAYMLEIKKVGDSLSTHTFSKTNNGQIIWTESYLGEQPYGNWVRYDKRGNVENTLDYNFVIQYGELIPEKAFLLKDLRVDMRTDENTQTIQRHIREKFRYPELAMEMGKQGKVTVQFTIDESGKVGNLRILEGIHISLDTECFRIMNSLKELKPYEKDGKKVMVYYTLPITFRMV